MYIDFPPEGIDSMGEVETLYPLRKFLANAKEMISGFLASGNYVGSSQKCHTHESPVPDP